MKITIFRLDYKNPAPNGLRVLPNLTSVVDITDINEVKSVGVEFDSKEEAESFIAKFPKYLKLRVGTLSGVMNEQKQWITVPYVSIQFNTFWMNGVTETKNETAIRNREKFISILKTIVS